MSEKLERAAVERFPDKSREAIREAARKYQEAQPIPAKDFPGEKWFHQTNLLGFLGGFAIQLLDALEDAERAEAAIREADTQGEDQ